MQSTNPVLDCTYLSGWDLDADLFNSLRKLLWFDSAIVVEVEVLEGLFEDGLLRLSAFCLFGEFVFEFSLEAVLSD